MRFISSGNWDFIVVSIVNKNTRVPQHACKDTEALSFYKSSHIIEVKQKYNKTPTNKGYEWWGLNLYKNSAKLNQQTIVNHKTEIGRTSAYRPTKRIITTILHTQNTKPTVVVGLIIYILIFLWGHIFYFIKDHVKDKEAY